MMAASHVIEMVDDILSLNQPFYQSSSNNNNSIKQSLPLSIQLWKW